MSAPVSVCIIASNEEANLPRCLSSVAWAEDVVVVVDSRSGDATERLARESGARVLVHSYEGNIEQKNFALSQAKHDWVFALDADEVAEPKLAARVQEVVARDSGPLGFEVNRVTYHLGRWIRHGDFHPDWQLRLFRRSRGRWAGVNPHGRVRVDGAIERMAGEIEHYSYRDLADQVERIQSFSEIQARALAGTGRRVRLTDLVLRPPARFLRGYFLKQGFRDGVPGFVIATASAFHVFLKYAKLWELHRRNSGEPQGSGPGPSGAS